MKDLRKLYKDVAEKLINKTMENLDTLVREGRSPDLYWKPTKAITEALLWAHRQGFKEGQRSMQDVIEKFDSEDGSSQN